MRKETPASDMARRRLPGGCSIILPAALALALFIAFAGLGITGHDPRLLWYQYQTVDATHVTRAHLDHNGMMAPLDRTVTDTRAAQALYDMAFALPVYPPVMHCPLGPAVVYHLAFSRQGAAVLTDDLSLDGFISVSLGGVDTRLCDERFLAARTNTRHVCGGDYAATCLCAQPAHTTNHADS